MGIFEETLLENGAGRQILFEDLPEEEVSFPIDLPFFRGAGEYFKLVSSEKVGFRS